MSLLYIMRLLYVLLVSSYFFVKYEKRGHSRVSQFCFSLSSTSRHNVTGLCKYNMVTTGVCSTTCTGDLVRAIIYPQLWRDLQEPRMIYRTIRIIRAKRRDVGKPHELENSWKINNKDVHPITSQLCILHSLLYLNSDNVPTSNNA